MKKLFLTLSFACIISLAHAQLEPYTDFETSDEVTYITTTKVSENMIDYYLEGLSKTWLEAQKFRKEKGYITDYKVYVSDLPNSGEFNVITWITFANDAATRGSEKIFKEVQAHMLSNAAPEEEREEIVIKGYPTMRRIVGQYRIRSVTFKN